MSPYSIGDVASQEWDRQLENIKPPAVATIFNQDIGIPSLAQDSRLKNSKYGPNFYLNIMR